MSQPIVVEVSIKKNRGDELEVVVDRKSVTAYRTRGDEVEWRRVGDATAYNLKLTPKKNGAMHWPFPGGSLKEVEKGKLASGRIREDVSNGIYGYTVSLKKKKGSKLPKVAPLDPDIVIDDDHRGYLVDAIGEFDKRFERIEGLLEEAVAQLRLRANVKED